MSEHYDADPARGCGLAILIGIGLWVALFAFVWWVTS